MELIDTPIVSWYSPEKGIPSILFIRLVFPTPKSPTKQHLIFILIDAVMQFQEKSKEVLQKEPQFKGLQQYTMRDYASLLLSFIGIGEASLIEPLPNWDDNSRLTKGMYLANFYLSDGNALFNGQPKQVMDCRLFEMTFFNKTRQYAYDYCHMLATLTPQEIQKLDSEINEVLF